MHALWALQLTVEGSVVAVTPSKTPPPDSAEMVIELMVRVEAVKAIALPNLSATEYVTWLVVNSAPVK
jgi:hypothetical protein